jgi:hypothetical protein
MKKGQILSFWIPFELKDKLDKYRASYVDKSRSNYICSAIEEWLNDPKRKYLVDKPDDEYERVDFDTE